jgi:dCTP deaminase
VLAMKSGDIIVSPFNDKFLQPASVDLHLDKHFLVFNTYDAVAIDVKKPVDHLMKEVEISENRPFILHPGEFALGMVFEETGVSDGYVGRLEGKSSIGRLGVMVHVTAGYLDPGNSLKMTLELYNTAPLPVLLYYKMPIAQMAFEKISNPAQAPYNSDKKLNSKYYGDSKPRASQMWKNF